MPLICRKCLNNSFRWIRDKNSNIAICNFCGKEINFNNSTELSEGDLCRKCNTKIIIKESKFKPSKLNKPYYYNAYYFCPKCKTMYLSDKFKIIN